MRVANEIYADEVLAASSQRGPDTRETRFGERDDVQAQRRSPMSQAEQDRRIDYVEFPATRMDETKAFYSAVFGWQFTDYGPDYTSFKDGRLSGGFSKSSQAPAGGALVVIYAADLSAIEAAVKEHGGQITRATFEFPGGRRFHFSDPSGNELAVWSDR
jgi:predicted enzyme related to lactoylglutathione lyase